VGLRAAIGVAVLLLIAVGLLVWRQRAPRKTQQAENRQPAAAAAAKPTAPWDDAITDKIGRLQADVDRLQSEAFGDFANDAIDASLEQLTSDVDRLELEVIDQGNRNAVGP
jgi:hypothetical protein